ncbi:unnamed protein product [Lepeophtheirus salmonis]|uniref:(salmon louse) hypothetical protein n=1 Tax=Lepeophtheirus salmonis TaxID=72036 RepID=A0A7R8D026_LEPSM|nr:unnamed protein product [Lepeophtheirus salmonis]CAF2939906.1 unnamed protein product [Lepeophtheirus salmonis]
MTQPKVVSTGGKKDESLELLESGKKEKLSKSVEETPKVPHVVPVKPLIANNLSDSRKDSSSASDVVLKRMEKVTSNENINSTVPSANSPVIENSLKIIGTPVPSRPTLSTSIPPLSKAPPPSTPPVLQTPSQIQSPFIKKPTLKKIQVESPSIINNIEDNVEITIQLIAYLVVDGEVGKKRMSTAYSDSSMSDDDGSFFQYPSGLQKQISLGKHMALKQLQCFASPPIKRINDIMIPSNDLTYGEEDRQRRVSRFLRPRFLRHSPKEDSIYAKMKELEEEEKRKSRFLKRKSKPAMLQRVVMFCLHCQFSSNVSRDKEQLTSQVLVNPSSKVSFHCPQPFVAHNKPISSDHPSCPVPISELNKRRIIYPYGGAKSDGPLNKHALISNSIIAAAERKKRETYGRSTTMELPKKAMISSIINPRTITRRSISKDLHDTAEDLRLRNATTWNEFEPKSTTTPPIANHHRSSRNQLPRHSNSFTRSDWRRTSVPERGKDF